MSTPPTSPSSDLYSEIQSLPTPIADFFSDALTASTTANPSNAPLICLLRYAGDGAAGAFVGAILGCGSGLINKKGFKGSFSDSGYAAKILLAVNGLGGLVECFLKRLRGKDDVINTTVGGCCTGLALSYSVAPQALLQGCLGYGAFTFFLNVLTKKPLSGSALALPDSCCGKRRHFDELPPLAIPLPNELKESFSSFCQTLRK